MTFLVASSSPLAGKFVVKKYAGWGILGADIPTTGDNGGSPVLNDSPQAGSEYHWRLETAPSSGTVTIYPDLTFTHTGAADGVWTWQYRLYEDGVSQGVSTVTDTFGNIATLSVSESADTLSASATVDNVVNASLSVTESNDSISSSATIDGGIAASLIVTESDDELAVQSAIALSSALNTADSNDSVVSSTEVGIDCLSSLSENSDTLTAAAFILSGSNAITVESMVRLAEIWARMELDATKPLVTSATLLTVGTISQDISTGGAVRTGATLVPTIDPDTMITEVWQRLGLDPDNALTQTNTSIDVGNIHLNVSGNDTLTVQRV